MDIVWLTEAALVKVAEELSVREAVVELVRKEDATMPLGLQVLVEEVEEEL